MCNIALVTFFGLQYWSASMNNIYEHIKMSFFCVLSLVKLTKMSWNFLKIGSWNFTSCCWEPCTFQCYNLVCDLCTLPSKLVPLNPKRGTDRQRPQSSLNTEKETVGKCTKQGMCCEENLASGLHLVLGYSTGSNWNCRERRPKTCKLPQTATNYFVTLIPSEKDMGRKWCDTFLISASGCTGEEFQQLMSLLESQMPFSHPVIYVYDQNAFNWPSFSCKSNHYVCVLSVVVLSFVQIMNVCCWSYVFMCILIAIPQCICMIRRECRQLYFYLSHCYSIACNRL